MARARDCRSPLRRGRVRDRDARPDRGRLAFRAWRRPRRSSPSRRSVTPCPIRPRPSRSARRPPRRPSPGSSRQQVLNLIDLMLRRGRIRAAAAPGGRVPPPRQHPPGDHPGHRHQRVAAQPGRSPGAHGADGAVHRRSDRARRQGRPQPAGRPGRAGRRPPDRRKRPEPPRAPAESARFGRPLGDLRPMAIRSDEITSIIKSAIDGFEAGVETRSVGTVVEVGDGIAQIYGLAGALSSELLEFPGGLIGMALNLDEETVGAVILGDATAIKEGDTVKTTGRGGRGPGRRGPARPRGRSAGPPARRQGPDRVDGHPARRADRPGRHRPPGGRHAGPDRHQGHRRARSRSAAASAS